MKALLCLLTFAVLLIASTGFAQTATVGKDCTVSWAANTEPDLASYRVYGTLTPAGGVAVVKTLDILKPSTSTTCAALGLQTGGILSVQIDAVDQLGNRSAKTIPVTATQDVSPPAQPSGLTVTPNP
jgi:hypothetical protein